MPMENFDKITSANFDAWLSDNDGVIIVHKKLCPHCQIMAKVLDKVTAKKSMRIGCIDSGDEPGLCEKLGAARVPMLCAARNGEIYAKFTGIMNPAETMKWLAGGK